MISTGLPEVPAAGRFTVISAESYRIDHAITGRAKEYEGADAFAEDETATLEIPAA